MEMKAHYRVIKSLSIMLELWKMELNLTPVETEATDLASPLEKVK